MGLFNKLKEALFDEEEPTEKITITPEMRNEELPKKEMTFQRPEPVKTVEEPKHTIDLHETIIKEEPKRENVSERELFKTKPTFTFPEFDEKEFEEENNIPPVPKVVQHQQVVQHKPVAEPPRPQRTYEVERVKRTEKRTDYGKYEKTEIVETTERRKFKPSPIISPVYGVLNKDYQKDDIVKRNSDGNIDIQSVRDKAFGEKKPVEVKEEPKTVFYEETETVTISDPISATNSIKTIDELLEDTDEVIIDIDRDIRIDEDITQEDIHEENPEEPKEDTMDIKVPTPGDDTSDLFDLIDSMYDEKGGED